MNAERITFPFIIIIYQIHKGNERIEWCGLFISFRLNRDYTVVTEKRKY